MRFGLLILALSGAGCSASASSIRVHVSARHPLGEAVAVRVDVTNATTEFSR